MSLNTIVVEGTLKADGTLELDEKPNLPPGRVSVTVVPQPQNPPIPPADITDPEVWQLMIQESGWLEGEEGLERFLEWDRQRRQAGIRIKVPRPGPGLLKGTILYMAPDFDAPFEDMKEYME